MRPRNTWLGEPPPIDVHAELPAPFPELSRLAILVGAGVSIPGGLPGAGEFLREFYDACLPAECSGFDPGLRFELVLDVVQSSFDHDLRILDVFDAGVPHANHRRLHELACRGALVITTNFDHLVEIAGPRRLRVRAAAEDFDDEAGEPTSAEIWHLHGLLTDPYEHAERRSTVVASIRDCWISRGLFALDRRKGAALRRALSSRDLLVFGYSGSDDFDIAPAIEEIEASTRVTWVQHGDARDEDLARGLRAIHVEGDGTCWYRAPSANCLAAMITRKTRSPESVRLVAGATTELLAGIAGAQQGEPRDAVSREERLRRLRERLARWRRRCLGSRAARYLLAVRLCEAAGRQRERDRLLASWLERAPSESSQDACALGYRVNLVGAALEHGIAPRNTPPADPPLDEFLKAQPAVHAALKTSLGRQLRSAGCNETAITAFRKSLELREESGFLRDIEAARHDLALALFQSGHPTGALDEAETCATRTLAESKRTPSPEGIARSSLLLGRIHERRAALADETEQEPHLRAAVRAYRRACEAARHSGLEQLVATTSGEAGLFLHESGDVDVLPEAAWLLAEASRIHLRDGQWGAAVTTCSNLALCLDRLGDRDRGLRAHCETYKAARRIGRTTKAIRFVRDALTAILDGATDDEVVFGAARELERRGVRL